MSSLVLATTGLSRRALLLNCCYGCGILCFGHFLFVVWAVLIRWIQMKSGQPASAEAPAIYTTILQFYLALPFLLWIVFPYWDKLSESRRASHEPLKQEAE